MNTMLKSFRKLYQPSDRHGSVILCTEGTIEMNNFKLEFQVKGGDVGLRGVTNGRLWLQT